MKILKNAKVFTNFLHNYIVASKNWDNNSTEAELQPLGKNVKFKFAENNESQIHINIHYLDFTWLGTKNSK